MNEAPCKHCGKAWGVHWAPGAFCSIADDVTPETATRYEPDAGTIREENYRPRFYVEVCKEEGGSFEPDPENLTMFLQQQMAEFSAKNALNRFPVTRVLEEKAIYRRK